MEPVKALPHAVEVVDILRGDEPGHLPGPTGEVEKVLEHHRYHHVKVDVRAEYLEGDKEERGEGRATRAVGLGARAARGLAHHCVRHEARPAVVCKAFKHNEHCAGKRLKVAVGVEVLLARNEAEQVHPQHRPHVDDQHEDCHDVEERWEAQHESEEQRSELSRRLDEAHDPQHTQQHHHAKYNRREARLEAARCGESAKESHHHEGEVESPPAVAKVRPAVRRHPQGCLGVVRVCDELEAASVERVPSLVVLNAVVIARHETHAAED